MSRTRLFLCLALLTAPLGGCLGIDAQPTTLAAAGPGAPNGNAVPAVSELERGKIAFRARDYGLAEERFRSAVESTPDNAEAWLGLAAVYDEMRRFDRADVAYRQVVRVGGTSVALLNNRGYSNLIRGRYREARRDFLAAQARDPSNPFVAANLRLLARRGRNVDL